jgi:arylsulfatase A-like enzyme
MRAAADWIRTSAPQHERFFLMVDEFDPHEPFDTPEPYASLYNGVEAGAERAIWPPYLIDAVSRGLLEPTRARQLRNNYGSKLTMIDHWFGRLLEAIDDSGLAGTTGVVLCTDHGHYLGEHDLFGKPAAPVYGELGRIPLLVRWPGRPARDIDALTTSVDLHATIADLFDAEVGHPTHGTSLLPLVENTASSVRELALFGYWGRHVGVTDGRRRYLRGCGDENLPLSMWSNRWSTMPVHPLPELRLPRPDDRAELRTMPGTSVPVIVQPFGPGDALPYWALGPAPSETLLFDTSVDPGETENRAGGRDEAELVDGLAGSLHGISAPDDLLARLGLA